MLKAGDLSPAIAGAALDRARADRTALSQTRERRDEREAAKLIRMLPSAAALYRAKVPAIRERTLDPVTMNLARLAISEMCGGTIRLRPADSGIHLIAEVGLNRTALIRAAGGDVLSGSGGTLPFQKLLIPLR